MLAGSSAIVTDPGTAGVNATVNVPASRDADIALLKRLRAQTCDMVVEARAFSLELSGHFGTVRDVIDQRLAFALLRRELESDQ